MTKHSELMKELEIRQQSSLRIFELLKDIRRKALEAGYQDGDAAFDALKTSAELFLKDGNATHSTS